METGIDSSINSRVERRRLATTERHVGNGALEALLLSSLGGGNGVQVRLSGPLNTLHDISHGTAAVAAENLDSVDIGLLGDTVLGTGDSTGAVSTVTVAVDISITRGDGLAPVGTALKVNVLGVGTGVNDVGINALTAVLGVDVLVEGTKREAGTVGDTSKTPGGVLLSDGLGVRQSANDLIPLNVLDVGVLANLVQNGVIKVTSVAQEVRANLVGVLEAIVDNVVFVRP